jgi:lysophospholipase L1-like esterase
MAGFLPLISLLAVACAYGKTSIACVGDSITEGFGLASDRDLFRRKPGLGTYPEHLGKLFGNDYEVSNFGRTGATMQRTGDLPYVNTSLYRDLLQSNPDIVIIMLGTNDAKLKKLGGPENWEVDERTGQPVFHNAQFELDYKEMIDVIKSLPSKPTIFTVIPPPLYRSHWVLSQTVINQFLPKLIPRINSENGLPHRSIDIFDAMGGASLSQPGLIADGVHPNKRGYSHLASFIHRALLASMQQTPAPAPVVTPSTTTAVTAPSLHPTSAPTELLLQHMCCDMLSNMAWTLLG